MEQAGALKYELLPATQIGNRAENAGFRVVISDVFFR
jgi:hypothetical protein